MIFNKYEFESQAAWDIAKQTLYITEILDEEEVRYLRPEVNSVVEIGHICLLWGEDNCENLSTTWAVDILWNESSDRLSANLVYPKPNAQVHTFSGDSDLYLQSYCLEFPESPYCKL